MASSIDPPRTPAAPAALALAEAALQRQTLLLAQRSGGAGQGAQAGAAEPAFTALPQGAPTPSVATAAVPPPLPVPAQADRVSLSAQAQGSLRDEEARQAGLPGQPRSAMPMTASALPSITIGDAAARGSGGSAGRRAAPSTGGADRSSVTPGAAGLPTAALRGAGWPTAGVAAPVRQMLDALVRQLTATGPAQRIVAAQPWPAGLPEWLADDPAGLPPLRTWLVGQGAVHTAEGSRAFSLALRVPAAWAESQAATRAPAAPGNDARMAAAPGSGSSGGGAAAAPQGGLTAAFAGRPQALTSGLYALVLQSADAAAGRGSPNAATSALLSVDFAPWLASQAATVYGRDPRLADPWLQMAALQAGGWRPPEGDDDPGRRAENCDAPGCPYAGRAACLQPFCLAMRVAPAGEVQRLENPPTRSP